MIEKAPGESQGLFAFIFNNMDPDFERYIDAMLEWARDNPPRSRRAKLIDLFIKGGHKLYLLPRRIRYQMVKKKSEAFFERGRLYQLNPINDQILKEIALYSMEDIEFAVEEGDRGDFTPFLLKKAPRKLVEKQLFMLIEIRRFRFDYCILKVLAGDQLSGIILYGKSAMYPWEVFTDITE